MDAARAAARDYELALERDAYAHGEVAFEHTDSPEFEKKVERRAEQDYRFKAVTLVKTIVEADEALMAPGLALEDRIWPQRRTRPLPRRRPPPLPLPFMFPRALKTAPWPLPPPLAWLWIPPTEPRRLPLPPPRLIRMSNRTRCNQLTKGGARGSMLLLTPPMALPMTHTPPPSLAT